MTATKLRFFLDECVPRAVGNTLSDSGHEVIFLQDVIATGSPDQLVCAVAEANGAILVSFDNDMKRLAARRGMSNARFKKLSLLKLHCGAPKASRRIFDALSLIEHEWNYNEGKRDRRIFVSIGDLNIITYR